VGTTSDWRGRKVLITGATGFIGRHLVERALRDEATVTTLSRTPANIPGTDAHLTVDIGDREATQRAIGELQPDAILHAASSGVSENTEFLEMLRSNVAGTDNLLSASRSLKKPPAVVIAGSGYEYALQSRPLTEDDPINPASAYGISKAAATFCAANYSAEIPITVLRIFNVYGPGEHTPRLLPYIVENAKLGKSIELTPCEQIRDFVYVRDIASIFWRALECMPEDNHLRILNVGSGSAVPLKSFVCTVARVLEERGLKIRVKFGARPYKPGEPMYYAANISRLWSILGSLQPTAFDTGIRQTLEASL
jgi:nucleoside-diphosphate-sugar epimerase